MAQEGVEIVRRYVEAHNGTPEEVVAEARALWDIDGDYYPVGKFPEARPCHGLEEISAFVVRFRQAWSDLAVRTQDVIEVSDDRVLARMTMQTSGRGSGMKVESDIYVCAWLRRGRLIRVEDHLTLAGALGSLGLEGDTLEAAGLVG